MIQGPHALRAWRGGLACAIACVLIAPAATAGVLALGHDSTGQLAVTDVDTGGYSASVPDCCAIQSGSVAAQVALSRVWFVENQGDTQTLHALSYGAATAPGPYPLDPNFRITHWQFDAAKKRFIGLALHKIRGMDDTLESVTVSITGDVSSLGTPASGEAAVTAVRAGISAYAPVTSSLYAIGTLQGGVNGPAQKLLRFSFASATTAPVESWPLDPAAESVVALAVHPTNGTLYGLSYQAATTTTHLVRLDFPGGLTLISIGSGVSGGLSIEAGSVVIDPAANSLVALGRDANAATPLRVERFDLTSGNLTPGAVLSGVGLFYAPGIVFDSIFANGFEPAP
jgi:hypothetical protein